VLKQAVPVGMVHRDGGGGGLERVADVVEHRLHRGVQLGMRETGDETLQIRQSCSRFSGAVSMRFSSRPGAASCSALSCSAWLIRGEKRFW